MSKISIFPHIAELVLLELIKTEPAVQEFLLKQFTLPANSRMRVFQNVEFKFSSGEQIIFDGQHRVDLCLLVNEEELIPLEVKAGSELPKVKTCFLSHDNRRLAGNMLGILDRRFPDELSKSTLCVSLNGVGIKNFHATSWGIIAKRRNIAIWENPNASTFSTKPTLIALEDICSKVDEDAFNKVAESILYEPSYFQSWIGPVNS